MSCTGVQFFRIACGSRPASRLAVVALRWCNSKNTGMRRPHKTVKTVRHELVEYFAPLRMSSNLVPPRLVRYSKGHCSIVRRFSNFLATTGQIVQISDTCCRILRRLFSTAQPCFDQYALTPMPPAHYDYASRLNIWPLDCIG